MILTKEDNEKIEKIGYTQLLNLSAGTYVVKGLSEEKGIIELLGTNLAYIMGLKVPKNHLCKIGENYYILSEDLNTEGIFTEASKVYGLDCDNINVYDAIRIALRKFVNTEIADDILKLYFLDCLIQNWDRRLDNWGFLSVNGKSCVVAFDFDNSFCKNGELTYLHMGDNHYNSTFQDLAFFLENGIEQDIKKFLFYYELFRPELLFELLMFMKNTKQIASEEVIKHLIATYSANYQAIGAILEEKLKKGRN